MSTLNVRFTEKCDGKCPFCVDRMRACVEDAPVEELTRATVSSSCDEVLVLGGEPTLRWADLARYVGEVSTAGKKVILTTNGSSARHPDKFRELRGLSALNFSVHHPSLAVSSELTGVRLRGVDLACSVAVLRDMGVDVRLNTLLIRGFVDSRERVDEMVALAKSLGARVRFSEMIYPSYLDQKVFSWCACKFVSARDVFGDLGDLRELGCEQSFGEFSVKAFCRPVACHPPENPCTASPRPAPRPACDKPVANPCLGKKPKPKPKPEDPCRRGDGPSRCMACLHFTQGMVLGNDAAMYGGWGSLAGEES